MPENANCQYAPTTAVSYYNNTHIYTVFTLYSYCALCCYIYSSLFTSETGHFTVGEWVVDGFSISEKQI